MDRSTTETEGLGFEPWLETAAAAAALSILANADSSVVCLFTGAISGVKDFFLLLLGFGGSVISRVQLDLSSADCFEPFS